MTALTKFADKDLELLLLIRNFELALLDLFDAGKLNGTTHTCLGQEYVPVALAPLLREDFVFSNHRGHGHYLARFEDPSGLLAEIMGREGAVCSGVGGSQHIYRDGYLSTGVQGQSLPVAVGVALHYRRTGQDRIAVVHIGDGTWGEGAVYEALNMARLWSVPLLVVVEHNGIAQSTPTGAQLAGTIEDRAGSFGIDHYELHTADINVIRAELGPVVAEVRRGAPAVVQFHTVRLGPHSKGDDTRSAEELSDVRAREWSAEYARWFGDQFDAVDARQRERVAGLVADVSARPPSVWTASPAAAGSGATL
ncbi:MULTISPECIES: thiamine pyrophosphate-dependent dehydrogenase E1 component subunit alpha [unclassified Streptomyces]|uniref:thiamine pyrophosphate-dependent dehydrogenase E1 component subunit alpha n=1 Tax=unclassified Streptomyces TaxID=2593676 RepID=UPI002E7710E2|nr:thiamine pyrophosphate-dependent dehydrogenase E1 component subunit alpha [Streptomyces sp. JV184]MEE1745576.1 thiamine pyrophosphate-dependent dehydrogenase E1 component subunit alpha [Streptomyces sp. JV184]